MEKKAVGGIVLTLIVVDMVMLASTFNRLSLKPRLNALSKLRPIL